MCFNQTKSIRRDLVTWPNTTDKTRCVCVCVHLILVSISSLYFLVIVIVIVLSFFQLFVPGDWDSNDLELFFLPRFVYIIIMWVVFFVIHSKVTLFPNQVLFRWKKNLFNFIIIIEEKKRRKMDHWMINGYNPIMCWGFWVPKLTTATATAMKKDKSSQDLLASSDPCERKKRKKKFITWSRLQNFRIHNVWIIIIITNGFPFLFPFNSNMKQKNLSFHKLFAKRQPKW